MSFIPLRKKVSPGDKFDIDIFQNCVLQYNYCTKITFYRPSYLYFLRKFNYL